MKRIKKEGSIRKKEIMDRALSLFSEKGYETTSVQDIIDAVGVSKGAFSHHFRSQDELLNAIIQSYIHEAGHIAEDIAGRAVGSAIGKYRELFLALQQRRTEYRKKFLFLTRMMLSEENVLFAHRYSEKALAISLGPYTRILREGKENGEFRIGDPGMTAELLIRIGMTYRTKIGYRQLEIDGDPEAIHEIRRLVAFLQETFERILGVEPGTLSFIGQIFNASPQNQQQ